MSHFGNFIADVLAAEERAGHVITQKRLAERLGIKSSMLSRFMHLPHPSCTRKTLERMTAGISDDPKVQAGLQAAYLLDQRVGEAGDLVEVTVCGRAKEEDEGHYWNDIEALAKAAEKACLDKKDIAALINIIRGAYASPRLRRSMHDLGQIAEHDILR